MLQLTRKSRCKAASALVLIGYCLCMSRWCLASETLEGWFTSDWFFLLRDSRVLHLSRRAEHGRHSEECRENRGCLCGGSRCRGRHVTRRSRRS